VPAWVARLHDFRSRRSRWIQAACYGASCALLVGVWQAVGNDFGILFVPFTTTLQHLRELIADGTIGAALAVSAQVYVLSLGLSIVVGVSLGLILARIGWFAAAFEPWLFVLYATPTVSLVPFVFAAFGFGVGPQVLVSLLITVFPILFGVMEGARSIPQEYIDVAQSYGSSETQLWRDVVLPSVTPYAMTGIRQAIPLALVGTLVAEFFLNTTGVAAVLVEGTTEMNPAQVLAVVLLVSVIAIVLVGVGELLERYLVRWRRAEPS
jgi:NitT/TauT family transport system permease protein